MCMCVYIYTYTYIYTSIYTYITFSEHNFPTREPAGFFGASGFVAAGAAPCRLSTIISVTSITSIK